MGKVIYKIVEHDGGWAYVADGVYSETYPDHEQALAAAKAVAAEQRQPGEDTEIMFEDERYRWHLQRSAGSDRPDTEVES